MNHWIYFLNFKRVHRLYSNFLLLPNPVPANIKQAKSRWIKLLLGLAPSTQTWENPWTAWTWFAEIFIKIVNISWGQVNISYILLNVYEFGSKYCRDLLGVVTKWCFRLLYPVNFVLNPDFIAVKCVDILTCQNLVRGHF